MKVLLDTSVLVSSVVNAHGDHIRSFAVLNRIQTGIDEGFVAAHTLAEIYAVLTKFPPPSRHTPEQALLSIEENVFKHFKITALGANDYVALLRESALAGIQGGTIYDAILMRAAIKADVERIFTLNLRHFHAVAPTHLRPRLFSP